MGATRRRELVPCIASSCNIVAPASDEAQPDPQRFLACRRHEAWPRRSGQTKLRPCAIASLALECAYKHCVKTNPDS